MKSSLPSPTAADLERFQRLQEFGCIVMRVFYRAPETPADVHHILADGTRMGHQYTIPLTPWHHRGVVPYGMTAWEAKAKFGPSKARHPKEFIERFGTDAELLEMTNQLLEAMKKGRAAA